MLLYCFYFPPSLLLFCLVALYSRKTHNRHSLLFAVNSSQSNDNALTRHIETQSLGTVITEVRIMLWFDKTTTATQQMLWSQETRWKNTSRTRTRVLGKCWTKVLEWRGCQSVGNIGGHQGTQAGGYTKGTLVETLWDICLFFVNFLLGWSMTIFICKP